MYSPINSYTNLQPYILRFTLAYIFMNAFNKGDSGHKKLHFKSVMVRSNYLKASIGSMGREEIAYSTKCTPHISLHVQETEVFHAAVLGKKKLPLSIVLMKVFY